MGEEAGDTHAVCVRERDFLFNLTRELRNWVLPAGNWEGTSWQKGRVRLAPTPTPVDAFLSMTVKSGSPRCHVGAAAFRYFCLRMLNELLLSIETNVWAEKERKHFLF